MLITPALIVLLLVLGSVTKAAKAGAEISGMKVSIVGRGNEEGRGRKRQEEKHSAETLGR